MKPFFFVLIPILLDYFVDVVMVRVALFGFIIAEERVPQLCGWYGDALRLPYTIHYLYTMTRYNLAAEVTK